LLAAQKVQLQGRRQEEPGKRFAPFYGAVDATFRSLGEAAYWGVDEASGATKKWRRAMSAAETVRRPWHLQLATQQMGFFSSQLDRGD
jgi:hypothetical protein